MQCSQDRKPPVLRKKWKKDALEEALNMAPTLPSCCGEATAQHPVPLADVQEKHLPCPRGEHVSRARDSGGHEGSGQAFKQERRRFFQDLIAASLTKRDDKMSALGASQRITAEKLENKPSI